MDYPVKKSSYWISIKNTLSTIFKGAGKIEEKPLKVNHGASWDRPQGANPTFDPLNALAAFAVHSYTHAAASRAAQDLAALPLRILKGTGANTQIIDSGPAVDLFNEPSTGISPFDFREQLEIDLMLTGNSYILLLGPNENAPISMVRLHPAEVKIITTSEDGIVAFEHNSDGNIARYDPSRIIHTKTASWQKGSSSVYGTSPIEALKGDISADLNAMKLASEASAKGRPDILLSPSDPSDIWTKQQRQEILQSYLGLASQGGALCLSGAISLTELKLSPRDLEYSQSRKFAMENVSAVLGISPSVLGRPDANYATAKSQAVEYWNNQTKRAKRMSYSYSRIVKRFDPELRVEYDFSGVEALQEVRTERLKRIKEHVLLGMPVELAYKYENMEDAPINQYDQPIPDPESIGEEEDENTRQYKSALLKAVEHPIIKESKPRTKRDMIWYNWIAKVHSPQEKKMFRTMKKYLAGAKKRYVKRLKAQIKEQKSINGNLVIKSVTDWKELLAQEVEEKYLLEVAALDWAEGFMTHGLEVLEDIYKRAGIRLDLVELPQSSKQIAQYEVERFAKRVTKTTANSVQSIVEKSIIQGLPVIDMADILISAKAFSFDRAYMIARTETTKQLNSSANEAFKTGVQQGVKMKKQWLSSRDSLVRDKPYASHVYLDGQIVGVNEEFIGIKGDVAPSPASFGIAAEDINCRCTIIPYFED